VVASGIVKHTFFSASNMMCSPLLEACVLAAFKVPTVPRDTNYIVIIVESFSPSILGRTPCNVSSCTS